MRTKILAANWKMNHTLAEATAFAEAFEQLAAQGLPAGAQAIIAPAFPFLADMARRLGVLPGVSIAAQDLHDEESGAFTGEVSAAMIRSVGATHVIIGHSERRQYQGEDNALLLRKVRKALEHGLVPIFCIGETLAEREAGKVGEVIETQLREGLFEIQEPDIRRVVIAYEPVWAIGTGVVATPAQAQEVHAQVRALLDRRYGGEVANLLPVLYGGSMKPDNAAELLSQPDIDGGLVGGASLKAGSFWEIVQAAR
jgi:triosephosphate isomerase